ncbi:MAG: acetyltransferase [Gemmatimonadaceae bacterium]
MTDRASVNRILGSYGGDETGDQFSSRAVSATEGGVAPAKKMAIYGAGGFAREVAWLLSAAKPHLVFDFVGFIEDAADPNREVDGKPVLSWERFSLSYPDAVVAIGVGKPQAREKLALRCSAAGFDFPILIHDSVAMSDSVQLGSGSIVCCGSILTVNITVGNHVHVNLDCTVGHDARIDDFATLSPGVHVSGNVHIGQSAFIGTGATIVNGTAADPLVIGAGCVIAAGACVTKNTEENCLYAGVPAVLKKRFV